MDHDEAYAACRQATRDRADALPSAVWGCEICDGQMQIRSSHLNTDVYADDIKFKCDTCRHVRVHGVPFTDREAFEAEAERRPGTIVDFGLNKNENTEYNPAAADRLEALGYVARADSLR